jgi:hypothetical protein
MAGGTSMIPDRAEWGIAHVDSTHPGVVLVRDEDEARHLQATEYPNGEVVCRNRGEDWASAPGASCGG